MKIIETYKTILKNYKTVRLLKKMFKPFGIEVRCNFVQYQDIKTTDILVEFWSIEYHALLFVRDNIGITPARFYLYGVMPYLQDVAKQFMLPWEVKPTNSWLDKYSFLCDNPFLGCKSIEEMLVKTDLM